MNEPKFLTTDIEKQLWSLLSGVNIVPSERVTIDARSLVTLLRGLEEWQRIACWLGDVTAATASHLLEKKSTPLCERKRQVSILKTAAECFRYENTHALPFPNRWREVVRDRLESLIPKSKEP